MSLATKAARGGAITLASQLIKIFILLGSTIVLGRLLTPTDFGYVAMVVAVVGVGEVLRDFGLSMAALQAKSLSKAQQSNLFWINSLIGLILFLIAYFAAEPIAVFYGEPHLADITEVMSITFLAGGLATQFKVSINRELRFASLALIDIVPTVIGFAVAVAIALAGGGYWALVFQYTSLPVIALLIAILCANWLPGMPKRAPMKHLLSFGLSFAATQLISYATRNVDSIIIGRVQGAVQLGAYDRAYQLVMMPINQINTPMSRVAVPVLARVADEPERYEKYLRRSQLVSIYVTATIFSILCGMGDKIVVFVLGSQWEQAGTILQILSAGAVFRSLVQICYWVYMSKGLAKKQLHYFLVSQPILALFIVGGIFWGAEGVAAAHSIGFAVYWVASILWMGRVTGVKAWPLLKDASRAVIVLCAPAGVLAFLASNAIEDRGNLAAICLGLAFALLWFVIACVASKKIRGDLTDLRSFVRTAVRR